MPKVVINVCFGGFGVSKEGLELLAKIKGLPSDSEEIRKYDYGSEQDLRSDPDLVRVVEELGDKANGYCARLHIVDIPDGASWYVDEYDGNECVREGRVWH